jgi:hypothetical protein
VQRKAGDIGRLELASGHHAGLVLADSDLIGATVQAKAGAQSSTSDYRQQPDRSPLGKNITARPADA